MISTRVGLVGTATLGVSLAFVAASPGTERTRALAPEELTDVVRAYCVVCHNDQMMTGELSLEDFEVEHAAQRPQTAEKMITKLRAAMMPPPGVARPPGDTLAILVETLEEALDEAFAAAPNPGARTFQRLNRIEYERSIRELLGLEVDAANYLPADPRSANFDNIADVQMVSPTLLLAYLTAAREISGLALGDPNAAPFETGYSRPRRYSQWDRVEGAPFGTRGGISVVHQFPADGKYVFKMWFQESVLGSLPGRTASGEQIEISINGERKVLLEMDAWDGNLRPERHHAGGGGTRLRYRGLPSNLRGVHPAVRRTGRGCARSTRMVHGRPPDRYGSVPNHSSASYEPTGYHRALRGRRDLGDGQPQGDLLLSPGVTRGGAALR